MLVLAAGSVSVTSSLRSAMCEGLWTVYSGPVTFMAICKLYFIICEVCAEVLYSFALGLPVKCVHPSEGCFIKFIIIDPDHTHRRIVCLNC
jgi:hypothetical protein